MAVNFAARSAEVKQHHIDLFRQEEDRLGHLGPFIDATRQLWSDLPQRLPTAGIRFAGPWRVLCHLLNPDRLLELSTSMSNAWNAGSFGAAWAAMVKWLRETLSELGLDFLLIGIMEFLEDQVICKCAGQFSCALQRNVSGQAHRWFRPSPGGP